MVIIPNPAGICCGKINWPLKPKLISSDLLIKSFAKESMQDEKKRKKTHEWIESAVGRFFLFVFLSWSCRYLPYTVRLNKMKYNFPHSVKRHKLTNCWKEADVNTILILSGHKMFLNKPTTLVTLSCVLGADSNPKLIYILITWFSQVLHAFFQSFSCSLTHTPASAHVWKHNWIILLRMRRVCSTLCYCGYPRSLGEAYTTGSSCKRCNSFYM